MAVYEDGTRDCPACLTMEVANPNRVRGALNNLCFGCARAAHNEAMAGFALMQPWLKRHLSYADWRLENGLDLTESEAA